MDLSQTNSEIKKSPDVAQLTSSVQQAKLQKTVKYFKKCWITLYETLFYNKP